VGQNNDHFKEEPLPYVLTELLEWQNNDESCINILINSNAPLSIKRSIGYKKGFIIDENGHILGRRNDKPTPRKTMHFDIAKVVVDNLDIFKLGWYGSYDWLTNSDWIKEPDSFLPRAKDCYSRGFMKVYQKALIHYIGIPKLKQLQKDAKELPCVTEPDLWFIKNDGTFLFVEAKLDKRSVFDSQIAGLALLKEILNAQVKIIRVHQRGKIVKLNNDVPNKFDYYCSLLH
jgi:hypothetical protein